MVPSGFGLLIPVTFVLFLQRPAGFVPEDDQGCLIVDIQLPPGAALGRTEELVLEVEAQVLSEPEIEESVTVVDNSLIGGASSYTGFLILRLANWGTRDAKARDVTDRLQAGLRAYSHAKIQVINPPSLPGVGRGAACHSRFSCWTTRRSRTLRRFGTR